MKLHINPIVPTILLFLSIQCMAMEKQTTFLARAKQILAHLVPTKDALSPNTLPMVILKSITNKTNQRLIFTDKITNKSITLFPYQGENVDMKVELKSIKTTPQERQNLQLLTKKIEEQSQYMVSNEQGKNKHIHINLMPGGTEKEDGIKIGLPHERIFKFNNFNFVLFHKNITAVEVDIEIHEDRLNNNNFSIFPLPQEK